MKIAATIARDGSGKLAVLFLGDKKQTPTADAIFHDDAALAANGLSGEVEIMMLRAPLPWRRRVTVVGDAPVVTAPKRRGRPKLNEPNQ